MKLTVNQLRRIIKEEVSRLILEHEKSIERDGDDLYVVDDEGNRSYYGDVIGSDYEHLEDGDREPFQTGSGSGGAMGGYRRATPRRRW